MIILKCMCKLYYLHLFVKTGDGDGGLSGLSLIYVIIGCSALAGVCITATIVIVCCRNKEQSSPDSTGKRYYYYFYYYLFK